ncbi:unnamed protein product [Rhizoctonia solani]|uniref:DRBM domain-containing protein n=1 Tax=Rhizoctonia solani TaxID=456999 RepID=A0A8H3I3F6_9AGAM|nr:unnamed protein product [Rhizoctonia solani]
MASNYAINPNDFVMKLNNLLQAQGRLNNLTWKECSDGPAHGPEWTITAVIHAVYLISWNLSYLSGEEFGYGTHRTKQGARHEAARKTLQNLEMLEMVDEEPKEH